MTINEAYILVQGIYNKDQSGNIAPAQFNNFAQTAQISIINQILGNEQEYRPGVPLPRYGLGLNQKIMEDLRPLLLIPTGIVFAGGAYTYPLDSLYLYNLGLTDGTIITPCEWDEFQILMKSVIKPPTTQFPYYYVLGTNIYVGPTSITNALISYVRRPTDPVWGYTVVNNEPVYDAGTSQNFELGELLHLRICQRILQFVGINLSMEEVVQYASQMEAQGQ